MTKIPLSDLRAVAENRPDGYYDEVIRNGRIEMIESVVLDDDAYRELQKKFGPSLITIKPIPREQWPIWAKALAQFSKSEDKGIGDVVARMIGDEKSEKFKAWYLVTFGKPCGCNGRQKQWNTKYPLNLKAT